MNAYKLILGASLSVGIFTTTAQEQLPDPINPNLLQSLSCMEFAIYHEANNQSHAGKVAVAHVIVNRTKNVRFPKDVCSVIKQKYKGRCEFSFVCVPNWTKVKIPDNIRQLAFDIVVNRKIADNTNGALFFHHSSLPEWDGLMKVKVIGDHIFYRYKRTENNDKKKREVSEITV